MFQIVASLYDDINTPYLVTGHTIIAAFENSESSHEASVAGD
jgi:hypothetical protein